MNEHVIGQLECKMTGQWQQAQKRQHAEPLDDWIKRQPHFTRLGSGTRRRRQAAPLPGSQGLCAPRYLGDRPSGSHFLELLPS